VLDACSYTLCFKKRSPNIIDRNLKKNCQILIIFSTAIPDTTGHQKTSKFPPHQTSVSAVSGENGTNKILHFFFKAVFNYLITHILVHFVYISLSLTLMLFPFGFFPRS